MTAPAGMRRIDAAADGDGELRRAGLRPSRWSAGPGAVFAAHRHAATKRLYVVRGSISFDGAPLVEGDGVLIPAGHEHSAVAGDDGVTCVEAFE